MGLSTTTWKRIIVTPALAGLLFLTAGHAAAEPPGALRDGAWTWGYVILQNGWLDHETHRAQVQWTKQYLDWLFQTETVRN
jgi:hypothetical protein